MHDPHDLPGAAHSAGHSAGHSASNIDAAQQGGPQPAQPAQPAQPLTAQEASRSSRSGVSAASRPLLTSQQTPLDLDAEAFHLRPMRSTPLRALDEGVGDVAGVCCAVKASSPRAKRRKSEQTSENSWLSGQALLQWLLKRRAERGVSPTKPHSTIPGSSGRSVREDEPDRDSDVRSRASARTCHNAKKLLQEQLKHFKVLLGGHESDEAELTEFGLSAPPPAAKPHRRNQKSSPVHEGAVLVLPGTCLQVSPVLGAEATDAWDRIKRKVLLEATRAQRRASKAKAKKPDKEKSSAVPWRSLELSSELAAFDRALQQQRRRCELEPGRRVLMRQLGAQPKAGLFEDPPQGSPMASAALGAAMAGSLPAESTGNELQAAALLPSRSSGSLSQMVDAARPGLLGTWHQVESIPGKEGEEGKDVLLCTRLFRETCVGVSSTYAGRMAREGLTKDYPLAPAGGQEHCLCSSCSEWLSRSSSKSHQCQKHVGKPHAPKACPKGLKLFHQSWDGLELRLSFQHSRDRETVEISCEASLDNALRRLLWPQVWEATQVRSSWRLTKFDGSQSESCQSSLVHQDLRLKLPLDSLPQQPARFLLSSEQLALLKWIRQQEERPPFESQQRIRQALCEVRPASLLIFCPSSEVTSV